MRISLTTTYVALHLDAQVLCVWRYDLGNIKILRGKAYSYA